MAVNVRIDDNYALRSDAANWIIDEIRVNSKTEEEYSQAVAFYPRLTQALDGLLQRKLRGGDASSLHDLKRQIIKFQSQIEEELRA